jgi:catechol 2,3-dioxygenase-like lactoylglutathione lyase family enzyme
MEQRLSVITLGVADLARSRRFYVEGLGWRPALDMDEVVFFQAGGLVVGLYPDLAKDAGVEGRAAGLISLGHNVRERDGVDVLMAQAATAGATITQPARDMPWGGRSGYFADPDGHLWEIGWNPAWPIDAAGNMTLRAG